MQGGMNSNDYFKISKKHGEQHNQSRNTSEYIRDILRS